MAVRFSVTDAARPRGLFFLTLESDQMSAITWVADTSNRHPRDAPDWPADPPPRQQGVTTRGPRGRGGAPPRGKRGGGRRGARGNGRGPPPDPPPPPGAAPSPGRGPPGPCGQSHLGWGARPRGGGLIPVGGRPSEGGPPFPA